MFRTINFEISGVCNAKCKYCQTGIVNRDSMIEKRERVCGRERFVSLEDFKRAIMHMLDNKIISKDTIIQLFNWGEPFLHPNFKEIISFLDKHGFMYTLSTNASKPVFFTEKENLKNLVSIVFSMPGFSQESYDKMHGFRFEAIKKNIVDIIKNYRAHGFIGGTAISYHIYRHNMNEIGAAFEFAKANGIKLLAYAAFINDFNRMRKYIKNELSDEEVKEIREDLFWDIDKEKLNEFKELDKADYRCPNYISTVIDENCNVITCCGDSTVYKNIMEVKNAEEIDRWRTSSNICKECIATGQAYIWTTPTFHEDIFGETVEVKYGSGSPLMVRRLKSACRATMLSWAVKVKNCLPPSFYRKIIRLAFRIKAVALKCKNLWSGVSE